MESAPHPKRSKPVFLYVTFAVLILSSFLLIWSMQLESYPRLGMLAVRFALAGMYLGFFVLPFFVFPIIKNAFTEGRVFGLGDINRVVFSRIDNPLGFYFTVGIYCLIVALLLFLDGYIIWQGGFDIFTKP